MSTGNASPALTGTVTDTDASVTVRVNGSYYAAVNNGNGTWSLPQGDISPLGTGSYNVVAAGIDSGIEAFDATVNQLSVDTAAPTASHYRPSVTDTLASELVAIQFSEPVENFTLADLQLNLTAAA